MADYLDAYAAHHDLPVRSSVRATRLTKSGDEFLIATTVGDFTAPNVIIATGSYADPKVPSFAADLDPHIVQLHSSAYRNPSQLQPGGVLLVGGGNSGADISLEVVQTHPTWLAGPPVPHIPPDIDKWFARTVVVRGVRFAQRNVLCLRTPVGRRAAPKMRGKATPLIRVKPKWLAEAGVQRVGRVVGVHDGLPKLEDDQVLDVTNVIWCTGYRHDFPWIDLDTAFDEHGAPVHARGVSTEVAGLYFIGLEFQFALASASLWGPLGRQAGQPADVRPYGGLTVGPVEAAAHVQRVAFTGGRRTLGDVEAFPTSIRRCGPGSCRSRRCRSRRCRGCR